MANTDWNTMTFFETATVTGVAACLNAGADPNEQDRWGYTPLHFAAAFNSDPAIITTLVDAGAKLEARDHEWGATPLHWAAWSTNNPAIITVLLNKGAELNAKDQGDSTPLHAAAEHNANVNVIAALLDAGADITARDKGKRPGDYAKDNPVLKGSEVFRRLNEDVE